MPRNLRGCYRSVVIVALALPLLLSSNLQATATDFDSGYPCGAPHTRQAARDVADRRDYTEPYTETSSSSTTMSPREQMIRGYVNYSARVTLRYSERYKCVWGVIALNKDWPDGVLELHKAPAIWVDESFNGGRTTYFEQSGFREVNSGMSSTYTAGFGTDANSRRLNDEYAVRVCGRGMHTTTEVGASQKRERPWSPRPVGPAVPVWKKQFHENPVVCTPWQAVPS